MNDNAPMFPLSQYIVQGIEETIARGTDIIQGTGSYMRAAAGVEFRISGCFQKSHAAEILNPVFSVFNFILTV